MVSMLLPIVVAICSLITIAYLCIDHYLTWFPDIEIFHSFTERDAYLFFLCILPTCLGHMLTVWGHYFRAERMFQHAIGKVTAPREKKLQPSLWDRRIRGFTVHFWIAVAVLVSLNIVWFTVPMVLITQSYIDAWGQKTGVTRQIGNSAAYTLVGCAGCQIFFILRRSMLHALGFTYPEIIPLHRGLGRAIFCWATIHITTKLLGYHWAPDSHVSLAFDYNGRGLLNTMGLIAYISVFTLFISTLPWVRRRYFLVHISIHRVFITIFLLCMALHYPGPILWYYVMPSFILFLLDRFVPKMIQASTVYPEVICSFNDDCDVVHVVLRSSKPMKPYYPGDYITIQMSRISTLYHPFTIASYWPEDPYTIELFLRVHHTSRLSWTAKLAKICPSGGAPRRVRANVDGVFGDCRHEYLRSEVIILFVAGTALTTFMGLIKAIAAQIAATNEPLRIKMYLIGTFRTRSELHAYGSFLHQISLDPRFTRWLHVTLYVSRPDRPETLVSAHDRQAENNDTEVLTGDGASRRHLSCGTIVASVASGQPGKEGDTAADTYQPIVVESTPRQGHPVAEGIQPISSTSSSADPMSAHPNPTNEKLEQGTSPANLPSRGSLSTYEDRPLPTYPAANSAVLSKRLAKLDLSMSAAMILIPLAIFYGFRAVAWEGTPGWCTTGVTDISRWTAQCMWTYAVLPGLFQIIMMAVIGYTCLAIVRIRQRGNFINEEKDMEAKRSFSEEATANTPEGATDETSAKHQQHRGGLTMPSGRDWEDGDITYRHGRMNVRKHIDEFVAAGIGRKDRTVNDGESFQGRVTVIGGGPGGFVDMVQKHTQQADWKVEYIRETWTP